MRIDMYIAIRIDMRIDMIVDMCMYMCIDMANLGAEGPRAPLLIERVRL